MELKYNTKEKAIESERNHYERKAVTFEKLFKKNRKNENALKEENVKLKNQLSLAKQTFDQQIFDLQNKNETLKENLSYTTNELTNEISQLQMKCTELSSQLKTAEEECETYKTMTENFKEQLEEFKTLKSELEQERVNCQEAKMRVKELEYEVNSFGDWKELSKASHSRLTNCSDMEKELDRLRSANKNFQSSIGNKLLLEEQVHDLESRLKRAEHFNTEQIELKVKLEAAEKELSQWKKVGSDFIKKELTNNPINLRSSIEKLLHRDLLLMSEKTTVSSEKSSTQMRISEMENVSCSWNCALNQDFNVNFLVCHSTGDWNFQEAERELAEISQESSIGARQVAEETELDNSRAKLSKAVTGELRKGFNK